MSLTVIGVLLAVGGGFIVARAFRYRRLRNDDDARREAREAERRRHHFRGSLDMELQQGPEYGHPEGESASD